MFSTGNGSSFGVDITNGGVCVTNLPCSLKYFRHHIVSLTGLLGLHDLGALQYKTLGGIFGWMKYIIAGLLNTAGMQNAVLRYKWVPAASGWPQMLQ